MLGRQHPYTLCQALAEEALAMERAASPLTGAEPEAGAVDARRAAALVALSGINANEEAKGAPDTADDLATTLNALYHLKRSALCFSGGGIRSATFGLGVLQGLAQLSEHPDGALRTFDFISTVSGGGYLGGWLSRWRAADARGMEGVINELRVQPHDRADPEPPQVRHLRVYCNLLKPSFGPLSANTWVFISTVARNLILNWFLLIPLIAVVLLVPRIAVTLLGLVRHRPVMMPVLLGLAIAALLLGISAVRFITLNLPAFGKRQDGHREYVRRALLPMVLAAACLTVYWHVSGGLGYRYNTVWTFCGFGLLLHTVGTALAISGGSAKTRLHKAEIRRSSAAVAAGVSGILGGWITFVAIGAMHHLPPSMLNLNLLVVSGVPLVLLVFLVVIILLVGLTSKFMEDEDREWWMRLGAYVLLTIMIWLCVAGLALFSFKIRGFTYSYSVAAIGSSGGLLSFIVSKLGASTRGGSGRGAEDKAATMFGADSNTLLTALGVLGIVMVAASVCSFNESLIFGYGKSLLWDRHDWRALAAIIGFVIEAAIVLVVAASIDVNKFSHGMYRDMLIRTYLGASWHKHPNPFTGFDAMDNIAMANINRVPNDSKRVERPLHVINMTLNFLEGKWMAWKQPKGTPFTVTTLHSGSSVVGYQSSEYYAGNKGGITLGTAMAISGTSAGPNMGYYSSPALSVIMTLFNLRLGWWLPNPGPKGRKGWRAHSPSNALRPLLDEAFGRMTEQNEWIYLSDGGQFENLGLYEMVVRRCRRIVVVDASADSNYTFMDLGNAVRKIRIDLGINIVFAEGSLPKKQDRRHCAIATIHYDGVHEKGAENGTLLYIKPVLCGKEPADVSQYASTDISFPQQPTSEQWFSESQFESYRQLGLHTVQHIAQELKELGLAQDAASLDNFMACAEVHAQPNQKVRIPLDVRVIPQEPGGGREAAH